jgi:hypothetical protein
MKIVSINRLKRLTLKAFRVINRVQRKAEDATMWIEDTIIIDGKVIQYYIKHFETPSKYGINGGRISKLELRYQGDIICNFDRGWDVKTTTNLAKIALKQLLAEFN